MVRASDWRVHVQFMDQGLLHAEAHGSLALMPEDALHIITHPAGDELFRVVDRCLVTTDSQSAGSGSQEGDRSVEVENRAPVRVLAYKFWAISRVRFDVRMAKPPAPLGLGAGASQGSSSSSSSSAFALQPAGRAGSTVSFHLIRSNMLKQLSGAWCLEPLIAPGSAGLQVLGTRLCYQHDVRPKGLPPGVQFVPGMSGAVKMSVAKEVRQMVDKVDYVAEKVSRGLSVVTALEEAVQELREAGGSFKKLRSLEGRKQMERLQRSRQQLKSMPLTLDFEALEAVEP